MNDSTLLPKTATSLSSWVLLVAKAIEGYGLDSKGIFQQAGMDIEEIKKPHGRIPTESMKKVWDIAREQSGDPYIGIKVASYFQPNVFSALGMALAASHHVYDALKRAHRYSQMVSDGSSTELEETDDQVFFKLIPREGYQSPPNHFAVEGILGSLVHVMRLIAGDDFAPEAVEFQHEFDGDIGPYESFFGCTVSFGNPKNRLVFDRNRIFNEHDFANSTLTCTLDQWIEDHLSNFKEKLLTTKVSKYILKHLAYGEVDQQSVAKEMALSPRMLQRKLKDEGTSYSEILDDCRHKLAIQLISQNKLALSEVTYILGFSDQSNFSRAFKRWTGSTPHQFKEK